MEEIISTVTDEERWSEADCAMCCLYPGLFNRGVVRMERACVEAELTDTLNTLIEADLLSNCVMKEHVSHCNRNSRAL